MPTKPQGCIVEPRKSKSLYTAVLYDNVPESCASSSTGEVGPCSSYLKRITREHLARASMEEIESSASGSPSPESKERVTQLTEKVRRAYTEANGNPADGRWSFVAGLLRLGITRGGRRWLGVNTATEAPEIPKHLCVIPKTSEEWHELERKWKEEEDVKNKVQRWIVSAEFEPLTPETTVIREPAEGEELLSIKSNREPSGNSSRRLTIQTTLKKSSTLTGPLSGGSKLGFSVVKKFNTITSDKPGPRKTQAPFPLLHATSPTPPSPLDREGRTVPERNPSISVAPNQIPSVDHNNLSINGFLPPSFSLSQVQTSTPLPGRVNNARKPSPIPLVESLSLPSPVSSPKPTKTYGKPRNMLLASPASLDPEPSSSQPQGGVTDVTRKRSRSPSLVGGPATKRARLLVDEGAGAEHTSSQLSLQLPPSRNSTDGSPDVTPKKNLPRLKELLASAKHSRNEALRKRRFSGAHAEIPAASTGASGSGSGLDPLKAVTHGEPATATTPIHDSELVHHDSALGSARVPSLSAEAAEVEAEVMLPNIETKLVPCDAESSSRAPRHDLNGTMSDEPSTRDPALHDRVTLGSSPQTASEAGSQPDTTVEKALAWNESQPLSPIPSGSLDSNPFRMPSADPESLSSTHGVTTYNLYGLDTFDNPSPTKSLSSLADADSESDSDREEDERTGINLSNSLHLLDSEFQPQFTSTQKHHTGLDTDLPAAVFGSSLPSDVWGGDKLVSTSQLRAEVSSQVDELDKFMEADLGYDFVTPGL